MGVPQDALARAVWATASRLAAHRIEVEVALADAAGALPVPLPGLRVAPRHGVITGDLAVALVHHLPFEQARAWCPELAEEPYAARREQAADRVGLVGEIDAPPAEPGFGLRWRLGAITGPGLILALGRAGRLGFAWSEGVEAVQLTYAEADHTLLDRMWKLAGPPAPPPDVTGVRDPWLRQWPTHEAELDVDVPLPTLLATLHAAPEARPALLRALVGHTGRHPAEDPAILQPVPLDLGRERAAKWAGTLERLVSGRRLVASRRSDLEALGGEDQARALLAWAAAHPPPGCSTPGARPRATSS